MTLREVLGRLAQLRLEGVPEDAEVVIETARGAEKVAEVNATWRVNPKALTVVMQSAEYIRDLSVDPRRPE